MTKKQDEQDYDSDSLCSMQALIDRYTFEHDYTHSFLQLREFLSSKAVSIVKARLTRKDGKGRRPNNGSSLIFSS